jgi:hypothetical protein
VALTNGAETAPPKISERTQSRRLFHRLDAQGHAGVLARAAGLLLVGVVGVGGLGDRLAIGHLGRRRPQVDAELRQRLVDGDVEVGHAHAGEDRLVGGRLGVPVERRVFGHQAGERLAELGRVRLADGVDGDGGQRGGLGDGVKPQDTAAVAQGVVGGGFAQLDHRADVAGVEAGDGVGVLAAGHLQRADAHFGVVVAVPDARIGGQQAAEDAQIAGLAEVVLAALPDEDGQGGGHR